MSKRVSLGPCDSYDEWAESRMIDRIFWRHGRRVIWQTDQSHTVTLQTANFNEIPPQIGNFIAF